MTEEVKIMAKSRKIHGGMANGWRTWILGFINVSGRGAIQWLTPKTAPAKRMCIISEKLKKLVIKLMKEYNIEKVKIESDHIGNNCYEIWVSIIQKRHVNISGLPKWKEWENSNGVRNE
jgi:hypothetical protein